MDREPHYIDYEGIKLLYLDFSDMPNEKIRLFMEKCKKILRDLPQKSLLYLVNVKNMDYSVKSIKDFTNFSKFNDHFSKATAIIGMDSMKQTLYNVALAFSERDKKFIKTCNSEDEAKAWLKSVLDSEKAKEEAAKDSSEPLP
jgi:hypothetical protein